MLQSLMIFGAEVWDMSRMKRDKLLAAEGVAG
jgi:hypothetical protein